MAASQAPSSFGDGGDLWNRASAAELAFFSSWAQIRGTDSFHLCLLYLCCFLCECNNPKLGPENLMVNLCDCTYAVVGFFDFSSSLYSYLRSMIFYWVLVIPLIHSPL